MTQSERNDRKHGTATGAIGRVPYLPVVIDERRPVQHGHRELCRHKEERRYWCCSLLHAVCTLHRSYWVLNSCQAPRWQCCRVAEVPSPKQNMGSLASCSPTWPSAARFRNFSSFSSTVHANSCSHTCRPQAALCQECCRHIAGGGRCAPEAC